MKIQTIIDGLLSRARSIHEKTVDTVKIGDAQRDVSRVGVCFMGTAEVIQKARELGIEFLIVHEPVLYDHPDRDRADQPLVQMKKKLLEESGLTIWRYHDHIHDMPVDGIEEGMMRTLGWSGHMEERIVWKLDEPMTARRMAEDMKTKLGLGGVRIVGNTDVSFDTLKLAEGDPGIDTSYMDRLITSGFSGCLFIGEACEWGALEQIRDGAYFGMDIAAVVAGHAGIEEAAMERLAEELQALYPDLSVRFIKTGEVYEYI